jgi:hypothetical protein
MAIAWQLHEFNSPALHVHVREQFRVPGLPGRRRLRFQHEDVPPGSADHHRSTSGNRTCAWTPCQGSPGRQRPFGPSGRGHLSGGCPVRFRIDACRSNSFVSASYNSCMGVPWSGPPWAIALTPPPLAPHRHHFITCQHPFIRSACGQASLVPGGYTGDFGRQARLFPTGIVHVCLASQRSASLLPLSHRRTSATAPASGRHPCLPGQFQQTP